MKKTSENNVQEKAVVKPEPVVGKNTEVKKQDKAPSAENSSPKKKNTAPVKSPAKKTNYSVVISLLFVIALSSIGFAGYDFWLLRLQAPVNAQLINVQNTLESRINQLEQQLQKTQGQLSSEVQARESMQAEHQAVNAALQGITEKLGRSTVAWRMAEVEYLLTVANHRLSLAQDRKTAMAVFETADSRLKAIGDPSLLNVRKQIAKELTVLRAMPNVDISGLAMQVASLAEAVEQLPLMDKKRLAAATEKKTGNAPRDWQEIPAAVWNDIKSLVQVRRHQQPTEPLLPPKQAWFLYKNLQLKLEQAKLAVLQRDTALFVQSLEDVSRWLSAYFETESAAVSSMQASVKKLRDIELQPPVPDVSGSLRQLRAVMNARAPVNSAG